MVGNNKIYISRKMVFWIFIAIFPILPEYFRLFGIPVHEYLSALIFFIAFLYGVPQRKLRYCNKWLLPLFLLSVLSYGFWGEATSFLAYILSSVISMAAIIFFVDDYNDVYRALDTIILVGFVICIFGVIEKFTQFNIFSLIENFNLGAMGTEPTIRNGVARLESSFGQPIPFGIYLFFLNCAVLYRLHIGVDGKIKIILFGLTYIFTFIEAYWTGSRMAFMSIIFIQILLIISSHLTKRLMIVAAILLLLLFDYATGRILIGFLSKYITLLSGVLNQQGGNTGDVTSSYRMLLLPTLLPYLRGHWLFGSPVVKQAGFTFRIWGHTYYSIDNGILAELLGYGIIGLIKAALPLVYGFYLSIKLIKRGHTIGRYFLCAFIAYALNWLSVYQMSEKRILFSFVALLIAIDCFSIYKKC